MAKTYYKFETSLKEMSEEELRTHFKGVKKSELMRSIILNERDFMTVDYERSLRSFWYNGVKPILSKLGLLTKNDMTEEALTKWDNLLSKYATELVRAGEITYKQLKIVDSSRPRENPEPVFNTISNKVYGYQVTGAVYPNIILTTEKDTIYPIITKFAQIIGCSCLSGKGQNSLAAMEDLIRGMGELKDDIYILTMTDYDPSGYSIAATFKNQAEDILQALKIDKRVFIERVGIQPEQLTIEEIEQNKYTPKPGERGKDGFTPLEKWVFETGGINGEPYGLELDAFSPYQIRAIFASSIKKHIDKDKTTNFLKSAYIRAQALEAMQDKIKNIMLDIERVELENIKQVDFDLLDYAARGYSSLPIDILCNNDRDQAIKELALAYFK